MGRDFTEGDLVSVFKYLLLYCIFGLVLSGSLLYSINCIELWESVYTTHLLSSLCWISSNAIFFALIPAVWIEASSYLYYLTHVCKLLCHFGVWLYAAESVVFFRHYWARIFLRSSKLCCLLTIVGFVSWCFRTVKCTPVGLVAFLFIVIILIFIQGDQWLRIYWLLFNLNTSFRPTSFLLKSWGIRVQCFYWWCSKGSCVYPHVFSVHAIKLFESTYYAVLYNWYWLSIFDLHKLRYKISSYLSICFPFFPLLFW